MFTDYTCVNLKTVNLLKKKNNLSLLLESLRRWNCFIQTVFTCDAITCHVRKKKTANYKEHFSEFDNFGNENRYVSSNIEYTRPCANRQSASVENKTTTQQQQQQVIACPYVQCVFYNFSTMLRDSLMLLGVCVRRQLLHNLL